MEFSLYLHIPYCDSKCPYCDFNSHAVRQWPEDRYVAALSREMAVAASDPMWRGARVRTVFFGGGTPSLFAPKSIAALLENARRHWPFAPAAETTLEANPGTVDVAALAGFRAAGVNRLSFGVQSFQDKYLRVLGRIHDGETAIRAVRDARTAGFDDVNVDLMFAVPGQTVAEWLTDLQRAIDLGTTHISAYNLTIEEGTAFFALRRRGELRPLDEAVEVEMYAATERTLAAAGFDRYEISNYAQSGRSCRHNLQYWRLQPYLGLGAGAHSFAAPDRRWSNELGPEKYMSDVEARGGAVAWRETLSVEQATGEFVFLGLRCREGIAQGEFLRRFGIEFSAAFPHSAGLRDGGLLEQVDDWWRLTDRGRMVADGVFATFV